MDKILAIWEMGFVTNACGWSFVETKFNNRLHFYSFSWHCKSKQTLTVTMKINPQSKI